MKIATTTMTKSIPLEIKEFDPNKGIFKGYASAFFNIDRYHHIMDPSFWSADTIAKFLDDGFTAGLNHDWDNPIGKPLDVKVDNYGALVTHQLDLDDPEAKRVATKMEKGIIKKMSFAFRTYSYEYLDNEEDVKSYWQVNNYTATPEDVTKAKYGCLVLKSGEVYETCPVMIPANNNANLVAAGLSDEQSPNFIHSASLVAGQLKELSPDILAQFRDSELAKEFLKVLKPDEEAALTSEYNEELKNLRMDMLRNQAKFQRSLIKQ